jgi:hypothetical protein
MLGIIRIVFRLPVLTCHCLWVHSLILLWSHRYTLTRLWWIDFEICNNKCNVIDHPLFLLPSDDCCIHEYVCSSIWITFIIVLHYNLRYFFIWKAVPDSIGCYYKCFVIRSKTIENLYFWLTSDSYTSSNEITNWSSHC